MNGGDIVAEALGRHGIALIFTLCGGHISPILVGCKSRNIRVIDVRHEATAVFAADATARISGVPGVAAVTAGPGVTNSLTALENARMAQSPVVVLGGATATVLRGRGALQDIDHMALIRTHVKWSRRVTRVRNLRATIDEAFAVAVDGVPGPVFVECPIDLLYDQGVVRKWYGARSAGTSVRERALSWYLGRHLDRVFRPGEVRREHAPTRSVAPAKADVHKAARIIRDSERPVLVVGSQAMLDASETAALAAAVERLGLPTYLSGTARGLLGRSHPLLHRHRRKQALREADAVVLAGVPCDFRLDYGRHVGREATLISINRSFHDLTRNRRPQLAALCDPGQFVKQLAAQQSPRDRGAWSETLAGREAQRTAEIDSQIVEVIDPINPLRVCREVDEALSEDSFVVADGGDFVATASYIVAPRGPLRWLDPGPFGTLGVGAGFALAAKLFRPEAETWVLYGDGALGFSLPDFDSFVRHGLGIVAVVGNDASWAQIARDQVELLGDDIGTGLRRTDYHRAAEGLGGAGILVDDPGELSSALARAKALAHGGTPVLVNVHIGRTDFRKGSISV